MKHRILHIAIADLTCDPRAAARRIAAACQRQPPMRAVGLCQVNDTLIVPCEEDNPSQHREYVFAPLPAANPDEAATAIAERFFAGFSTIGCCDDGHQRWGLFAKVIK